MSINAKYITMNDVLSCRYNDKDNGWSGLSEETAEKYFNKMVYWLIRKTSYGSKLRQELNETKRAYIRSCGILDRLRVQFDDDGEERVVYCAGQDYPYELRLVKRIVAGRRIK